MGPGEVLGGRDLHVDLVVREVQGRHVPRRQDELRRPRVVLLDPALHPRERVVQALVERFDIEPFPDFSAK